jgi:hypothetical protein
MGAVSMTGVYVAIVAVALGAQPTKTALDDLGGILCGRWIGDVTLIADWPGLGKRGEKVVAYVAVNWIADGQAFEIEWHGGSGVSKEIFVWDAGDEKIRSMGVSSGGSTWRTVWSKRGDLWRGRSTEYLADGTKVAGGTIILTVQDGGRRLAFTNEGDGFIGDKKMDPLHDVYTRLGSESPADTPLQEYGDLLVGRWMGDIGLVRDWPGIGKEGDKIVEYATVKWSVDRTALIREWHGGEGCGRSITVWDPLEKKIKAVAVNSGGSTFTAMVEKDGEQWSWTLSGSLGDGTPQTGSGTIKLSDDGNKYDVAGKLVVGGEEVSFVDPYTRLAK